MPLRLPLRPRPPIPPPPASWAQHHRSWLEKPWSTAQPWRHEWVRAHPGVLLSFIRSHATRRHWVSLAKGFLRPVLMSQAVSMTLMLATLDVLGFTGQCVLWLGVNLGLIPLWQTDWVFWRFVDSLDADSGHSTGCFVPYAQQWFSRQEVAALTALVGPVNAARAPRRRL